MKKPPGIGTSSTRVVTVLSVSPIEEDHVVLNEAFSSHSQWIRYTDSQWTLNIRRTLASAVTALRRNRIPIVLCERDLLPGTWKEMLRHSTLLPNPPLLIVTSRIADEYLWAEALNLGAYDVLPKPFVVGEVARIVSLAWLHWKHQQEIPATAVKRMNAVSVA
jgi:DNA-binding response OmpR family regulator